MVRSKREGKPSPTSEALRSIGHLGHTLRMRTGGKGGKQFVLVTLSRAGGEMAQRELIERSDTSAAALSEVLSKLEAEGLVHRTQSAHDRRQLDVVLTDAGRVRAHEIALEREAFERQAFSCLTTDETDTLRDLLARVRDHWGQLEKGEVSA